MFKNSFTLLSEKIDAFFRLKGVRKVEQRFPALVGFVHERLGVQNFFGLPFTALLLVLFVNLSILTEISEHIVNSTQMKLVDSAVTLFFYRHRTDLLSSSIYYFTQLGSSVGIAITLVISIIVLHFKGTWHYNASLLVSVLGSGVSIYFTKAYFHRERPLEVAYYDLSTFSFPSGHATGAVALVGMFCVFLYQEKENIKGADWWITLGILYIILIGISRIYLGVHFLSDVIGGYLLGSLWIIVALSILEYLLLRKRNIQNELKNV